MDLNSFMWTWIYCKSYMCCWIWARMFMFHAIGKFENCVLNYVYQNCVQRIWHQIIGEVLPNFWINFWNNWNNCVWRYEFYACLQGRFCPILQLTTGKSYCFSCEWFWSQVASGIKSSFHVSFNTVSTQNRRKCHKGNKF